MNTHALSSLTLDGFPALVSFRAVRRRFDDDTDAVAPLGQAGSGKTTTPVMPAGFGRPPAVRPERIPVALVSDNFTVSGLRGQVREAILGGDHIRLRLSVGVGRPAEPTVKQPAGSLAGLAPGTEVAVAWDEQQAWAYRPGSAAAVPAMARR